MEEHSLRTTRTARYHTLGDPATATRSWIVLHGYGQLARYFLRPFAGLENGMLIAAPEGLSRFYTDPDHTRVGATWMTREDREHEIADQAEYLDRLVAHLIAGSGGAMRVNVLGFSQGVATACRWAVRGKTRFGKLVLWSGAIPPDIAPQEFRGALPKTNVVLVHGERDELTREDVLIRNETTLRDSGVAHRSVRFAGGHQLDRLVLERIMPG